MIVLDTHVWVWWSAASRSLGVKIRRRIDRAERVLIPSICLWEVAMLVEKGRLRFDRPALTWVRQALLIPGVEVADLTPEIAVRASGLGSGFPGDPADRIIVATALENRAPLATKDERLCRQGLVETIG